MDEAAFIKWMRERMEALGKTQDDVRKAAGITSQSAISNMFHGKRRIKLDERAAIEAYLKDETAETEPTIRWVPLIGLAPAGSWREAILMPMGEVPVRSSVAGKRAFAVEVDGDSMNQILRDGGWAVIDPDQTYLYDSRVYLVSNADHDATLKRYRSNPARFEPVSDNPEHETIYVVGELIRVVGRVVSYGNDDGL